ncbi:MAG: indole-3-glycerol phosphate synthase TrpC [Anaerolineae bacterium]
MILDAILQDVRSDLEARQAIVPAGTLRERIREVPESLDLVEALRRPGVALIAEIKRASPSQGTIRAELDAADQAEAYALGGADALSVLTEGRRFGGRLPDLLAAREGLARAGRNLPILRKDFVVDGYQLLEARAYGADAVLLIVAALDGDALARLYAQACDLGLTPLIEVHDQVELRRALALNPPLIGINNRDLRDMRVSLETTRVLRGQVPEGCLVVSESGVHGADEMRRLSGWGVDAALVGTALARAADPTAAVLELVEAGL